MIWRSCDQLPRHKLKHNSSCCVFSTYVSRVGLRSLQVPLWRKASFLRGPAGGSELSEVGSEEKNFCRKAAAVILSIPFTSSTLQLNWPHGRFRKRSVFRKIRRCSCWRSSCWRHSDLQVFVRGHSGFVCGAANGLHARPPSLKTSCWLLKCALEINAV